MSLLLTLGLGTDATVTPPSGGDTPYMNLLLPIVSVTLGPLYATEVNAAFLRVDGHDHSPGYGALVPTSGLDINANLAFNGFQATNLDAATFNIRAPNIPASLGTLYFSGQDFYVIDGQGNVIQVTAAGGVNVSGLGGWTGLTAPAQASYNSVTKTFALQSNTTGPKYGRLAVGTLRIFPMDPAAGLPYIEIATPAAGVTSYTLQLPPRVPATAGSQQILMLNNDGTSTLGPVPPGVISLLRMNTTGAVQPDVTVDPATMQLAGAGPYLLGVKPGGIGTTQLADGSVTAAKLAASNAQVSGILAGSVASSFAGTTAVGSVTYVASGALLRALIQAVAAGNSGGGAPFLGLNDATVSHYDMYVDGVVFSTAFPPYPVFTALTAGSHSIAIKYTQSSDGTFDASWADIQILVQGF